MPAPHPPGFTGVDWYARPTQRLAADLLGGAGSRPLAAAAQETARLASSYGAAAVELDRLLVRLDGAVELGARQDDRRRAGPLPQYARWLARHAADLAEYAAKLAGQAAAYETAARAMPSVAEAERQRADRESAQAAAAAGGAEPAAAALAGAAAESERVEQETHGTAAAVMVGFERAAEPLRAAWEFAPPPKVDAGRARDGKDAQDRGRGAGGRGLAGGGGGAGVPAAPLGAYLAASPQRERAGAGARTVAAAAAGSGAARGFPMMPMGLMGAGTGAGTRGGTHHGAVPSDGPEELPEAFVVHTAPGVLGTDGAETAEQL